MLLKRTPFIPLLSSLASIVSIPVHTADITGLVKTLRVLSGVNGSKVAVELNPLPRESGCFGALLFTEDMNEGAA